MKLRVAITLVLMCVLGMLHLYASDGDGGRNPLQLSIASPEGTIQDGKLLITATLTNVSDQDISAVQLNGDPSIAYEFIVYDPEHGNRDRRAASQEHRQRETVDENTNQITQGSATTVSLKPGQTFNETIDLGLYCDLTRSGTYLIRAVRYIPKEIGFSVTVSNELKVQIMPQSQQ
jgi:hypothetical protein